MIGIQRERESQENLCYQYDLMMINRTTILVTFSLFQNFSCCSYDDLNMFMWYYFLNAIAFEKKRMKMLIEKSGSFFPCGLVF